MTVNLNEIYRDPLLYQWYNPSFSYSENVVVINGKSILTYMPDEFQRVQINGKVETNKIPQNTNEFKVNYHLGIIEFHPTIQDGSNFTVTYYARGIIKHPAVRTYIQDKLNLINSDNVEDALQEIFSRINNIVASTGNSNTEIVDARYDGVNNITHPTLKSRLDKTDERVGVLNNLNTTQKNNLVSAINELNNNFQKQSQQSTTIGHGLNVINSSQNSPLDVKIEGRTLVNVSQNVLAPEKYYVLPDKKSKVKFADGTTYTGVAKFQGKAEKPILIRVENFEGKVAGSTVENPHISKVTANSSLVSPTSFGSEVSQAVYDRMKTQNNDSVIASNSNIGNMMQHLFSFNLIEAIERNVGKIPASDTAGKVAWLKNNIARITCNWWGYGSSPSGNKATVALWKANTNSWHTSGAVSHTNSVVTKLSHSSSPLYSDNTPTNNIDPNGFFHVIAYADPSDGVTASTIYTDYVELETELKPDAQLWNPRFPLYEVDTTEYANILTVWDENEVMRRYPMVESVQHVQNPYVIAEGENLHPSMYEYYSLHPNAAVISPEKIEFTHSSITQGAVFRVKVKISQPYTLSVTRTNGNIEVRKVSDGSLIASSSSDTGDLSFTPTVEEIEIKYINRTINVKAIFEKPMLTVGSTAKPFVPRNPSYLFAEVKLGSLADKKDILFKDNGDWRITKWIEKDVQLTGGLTWEFSTDYTGYKQVRTSISNSLSEQVNTSKVSKYNGNILGWRLSGLQVDEHLIKQGYLYLTISDSDSGWGENYTPTADEIKAYFNGWTVKTVDGNGKPTAWKSIVDGTDAPTQTLAYVKDNMAPGFTPYKLSYVLATPQTIVVSDKVEGDLVINGQTQVEVGSGVIVREKVIPQTSGFSNYYHLNNIGVDTVADAPLKNKVRTILKIFRNNIEDKQWIIQNSTTANGLQRAYINKKDYDPTAEYTVTYLVLERYLFTTNILSVIANYDSSLKSVVDNVVAKQSDLASNQQILIRSVAELYKRIKALGG